MAICEGTGNAVAGFEPKIRYIVDYERCGDMEQLHDIMEIINRNGYQLVSVTQDSRDIYTVFFRRCFVG